MTLNYKAFRDMCSLRGISQPQVKEDEEDYESDESEDIEMFTKLKGGHKS